MEKKRLGTSECAEISQYALKNQYLQFLYEKITQQFFFYDNFVFFRWFDQTRLTKNCFMTNIKKKRFFNPIFKYFIIYKKLFLTTYAF